MCTISILFDRWRQHTERHSAVSYAKGLNRSICHLGSGLWWAEGSTSSVVFVKWRQCAHMGGLIGTTWRIRLNRPSAAAMRFYVKLLWPLISTAYWWVLMYSCYGLPRTAKHLLSSLHYPVSSTFLNIHAVRRSAAFCSNSMLTVVPAVFGFMHAFGVVPSALTTVRLILVFTFQSLSSSHASFTFSYSFCFNLCLWALGIRYLFRVCHIVLL